MVPLREHDRRTRSIPVVTYLLLAVTAAIFMYQLTLRDAPPALFCSDLDESAAAIQKWAGTFQFFVCRYGAIPDEIHKLQDLWTLLTSLVIHGGWLHLIGNLLFLLVFGKGVEDVFGHLSYLLFYVAAGVLAQVVHVFVTPNSTVPSIGASGAISGLLGAYLVFFGRNSIRVLIGPFITTVPAMLLIGIWVIQQALSTYDVLLRFERAGSVAHESHVAGFVMGLIVAVSVRGMMRFLGQDAVDTAERGVEQAP